MLIVLDQFEQWLHAKKEEQNTELVQALRQCDGGRVQCIVMVRDDFWMAVTRFMRELEIRLVEGQNSAAVDLFDLDHARKVLAAFGRAFGKLPENPGETSKDQKEFLNQAVSGLAQEGKVISVRLALFAEMMKGKPWTPATLKAVGGTEGVGVTFLEETFSAATAPPEHRYHQKAARAVLKALLPETGTDIKGHMRSYAELLEASGYGEPSQGLRRPDPHSRQRNPPHHADRPGREGREQRFRSPGQAGAEILPTDPRLSGSLVAGLADPQAEGNAPGPGRTAAGGSGGGVERPPGEPATAVAVAVVQDPLADAEEELDAAAAEDDGEGGQVSCDAGLGPSGGPGRSIGWGVYEGHGMLKAHALRDRLLDADTNEVPTIVRRHAFLSPVDRSAAARSL